MSPRRAVIAILLWMMHQAAVSAQPVESMVRLPSSPTAGRDFSLLVELRNVKAVDVEAVEPLFDGPASFIGTTVRPLPFGDGPATLVEYRFMALDAGNLIITGLAVRLHRSMLQLGSWQVTIAADLSRPQRPASPASWVVPAEILAFYPFEARIAAAEPALKTPAALSVVGALTYPLENDQGWLVVALRPGLLELPAIELMADAGGRTQTVSTRTIKVEPLPAQVLSTRAVGNWRVSLSVEALPGIATVGDTLTWRALAEGSGSAGFAEPPHVRIIDPTGQRLPQESEALRFTAVNWSGSMLSGHSGAMGTVRLELPGEYRFSLEPYPWFDPESGRLRHAHAEAISIHVEPALATPWTVDADLLAWAVRVMQDLDEPSDAESGTSLVVPSLPAQRQATERQATERQATERQATERQATERQATERQPVDRWPAAGTNRSGRFAAVRIEPADTLRLASAVLSADPARALYEAARLERWSWTPPQVRRIADSAAAANGLSERWQDRFPWSGWPVWLAAVLLTIMALVLCLVPGSVSLARRIGFGSALAAMLLWGVIGLAVLERLYIHGVTFGGPARAVPAEAAAVQFWLEPGIMFRVLHPGNAWLHVEFPDGRSAWIPASSAGTF